MISIVVSTYNNLDELKATLESVSPCEYANVTIINGSTSPDIAAWLKDAAEKTFTIINEPDKGIYDAFNKGWINSQDELICYTNSGDLLINEENYLQQAEQFLNTHSDHDFVHGDIRFIDKELGDIRMKPTQKNIGYGMPFSHPSMVVRKSVFEQLKGFNATYKIAGDYDFVVRMIKAGAKGHYIPLVVNEMDGTGVSTQQEWLALKECKQSLVENSMFEGDIRWGYYIRCIKYFLRKLLDNLGLNSLKLFLKRRKY